MQHTTTRTTITIQPALLTRLRIASDKQGKPISHIIQEFVQAGLEKEEGTSVDQMYQELWVMVGMIKDPIPDASSRIDDILYGENGAWKGQDE